MRSLQLSTIGALAVTALFALTSPLHAQDENVAVEDGGIFASGWMGQIDARAASNGETLEDARLAEDGGALHVKTGPATTYWNPENRASGEYTVSATFHEPEYMALNDHPHPYGIVIGGNELGTDAQSYLYCAAYGNGRFIVRGFGPEPFQMNGRGEEHPAVNRAGEPGSPVTQEIAMTVRDDTVSCSINGTVVAEYDRAEVVQDGRLASTDGVYGLRFAHNTEALVSELALTTH